MKLYILSAAILLLMSGITLAGNPLEVSGQSQEELKKYENPKHGLSFLYPSEWKEPIEGDCEWCGPTFTLHEAAPPDYRSVLTGVTVIKLDKPFNQMSLGKVVNEKPCNCNTSKDFVAWDYTRTTNDGRKFVNDNQTVIGKNYSAWQTESTFTFGEGLGQYTLKTIKSYAINGNIGYKFEYVAPPGQAFNQYLEGYYNMLKTVTFSSPIPEKKPSFLNSSNFQNSSILSSVPPLKEEPVRILSSNDFIDSAGYLHVVGEIKNNTPANIQFVKVTGTFYDSSNQVVATDFTYTNPSDIGPGQKAPFELTLLSASIPVSQIDHYNLIASYD